MRAVRWLTVLVALLALGGAACGGGGDDGDDEAEATEDVEETDEVTDDATDEVTDEEDDEDEDDTGGGTQSADEYAATVCGVLLELTNQQNELVEMYNTSPTTDPVAVQAETIGFVDDFLADLDAARAELEGVVPDVDDGEEISQTFVDYIDETTTEIQTARDTFAAADPNSPAFVGDLAIFESAINILSATLSDPFSTITDQDLLAAFSEEPSCEEVVTVF
jgi:hypothetical protein